MTVDATQDDDLWSWVDAEPQESLAVPSGDAVTAILVVRNGADWLSDALRSLAALDVRPAIVYAVDNGSTDASRAVLEAASAAGSVSLVSGDAGWGFGRAVSAALAVDHSATEWLWLLHDDIVVRPDALSRLLEQTARTGDADLVGPMLLQPTRRTAASRIAELGVSISHTGRRELGLEPGEVAQGQHESADTLGVSTCGMLIRRRTYDELGGFDDAVPLYRDGVELGWRATLAGHKVVTCPAARIVHRQAGRRGHRPQTLADAAGLDPAAYDRSMAMRTVAAHAAGPAALGVTARLLLGTLIRALGFLLGKRVDLARQELAAAGDFARNAAAVRALRRRVRALPATGQTRRRVKRLRPRFWSSWAVGFDSAARAVSERMRTLTSGGDAMTLDELTGDDFAERSTRSRSRLALVGGAAAAVVLVLVAGRRVIGAGTVVSAGLLPAPATLGAAFASYVAPVAGLSDLPPAWLGLAALASVPFGVPAWSVVAAFLLGVPVAAVPCAWYLEPYVASVRARWLTAVLYGLLPVLVGGYSRGQVWLVAWTVVLPAFGVALRAWGTARGLDAWRAPAGAALALAVLTAIAPLAFPIGAACIVGVAIRRRAGRRRAGLAVLAAAVLLAPWAPALARHPGRLLTGPEPLLATLSTTPAWAAFLGRSAGPGLPPLWLSIAVAGLLWAGAAVALYLRPAAWAVWAGAAGLVTMGAMLTRVVVPVVGGHARPEATMWLVAGLGVLLVGSATAVDRARAELAEADFGLGQGLVVASSVLGAAALVLATGWWVWGGAGSPLTRSEATSVPAFVQDAEVAQHSRTLLVALSADQQVTWMIDDPGHPRWGDAEAGLVLGGSPDAVAAARAVVAQVVSGKQIDGLAQDLAALGVGHLQVSGATADVTAALGSTPGLQRGAEGPAGTVWVLTGKPSVVQVLDGGSVSYAAQSVPAGPPGRTLVVAEPQDASRVVTVGGTVLAPAPSPDWRAAYQLGSASGPVELRLDRGAPWWAWLQLAAVALLALFAAPTLRREEDEAPSAAPRRASRSLEALP